MTDNNLPVNPDGTNIAASTNRMPTRDELVAQIADLKTALSEEVTFREEVEASHQRENHYLALSLAVAEQEIAEIRMLTVNGPSEVQDVLSRSESLLGADTRMAVLNDVTTRAQKEAWDRASKTIFDAISAARRDGAGEPGPRAFQNPYDAIGAAEVDRELKVYFGRDGVALTVEPGHHNQIALRIWGDGTDFYTADIDEVVQLSDALREAVTRARRTTTEENS